MFLTTLTSAPSPPPRPVSRECFLDGTGLIVRTGSVLEASVLPLDRVCPPAWPECCDLRLDEEIEQDSAADSSGESSVGVALVTPLHSRSLATNSLTRCHGTFKRAGGDPLLTSLEFVVDESNQRASGPLDTQPHDADLDERVLIPGSEGPRFAWSWFSYLSRGNRLSCRLDWPNSR
jgi:hypothetical protein